MNEHNEPIYKIMVTGSAEDLYTLGLLFPEGAHPEFWVKSSILGAKEGLFDRVLNAEQRLTVVSGPGCAPLFDCFGLTTGYERAMVAREIIAPLNGYAALADSNFTPVVPISASREGRGGSAHMTLGMSAKTSPRLIVANRHPRLRELMPDRVDFMIKEPVAARATAVIAGPPSWSDYHRLLEDIAGCCGTTLDKLPETGLVERRPLKEFTKAANNHVVGRHGASKRDKTLVAHEMMDLREARQFVRSLVTRWIDQACGNTMPTDRVDGERLRFGLDDDDE